MAFAHVFGKGYVSVALYGNIVVVVENDEFAEFKSAREGSGFVFDAFLHAAVAAYRVGVVVYYVKALFVEFVGEIVFRNSHTYRVGDTLTERTGAGFHARANAVFGVPRGAGTELTEIHYVFFFKTEPEKIIKRVIEHGRVTCGKNESVPVVERGVFGVKGHVRKRRVTYRRGAERHAGVTGFGLFYGFRG